MLEYQSLAALAAVARDGSFERAAWALGITPSAVSQRIKGLEERLGAILIVRGQPCRPTAIGARLCAHVGQVQLLESDLVAALPGLAAPGAAARSRMRIAVNSDSLCTWFPAVAAAFAAETDAMLDLVLDDEAHTADRLRSGEVLAAITADPVAVPGCRTIALGALEYVAVATPRFVDRHFKEAISPATLSNAPMLRFDMRDDLQARWMQGAFGAAPAPPVHWIPSTQGMLDMALVGLAWGMTPTLLAAPYLASGRLVELHPHHRIEVELHWQHTRLSATYMDRLTSAVKLIAAKTLKTP